MYYMSWLSNWKHVKILQYYKYRNTLTYVSKVTYMVSKHNLPAVSAIGKQRALSLDFVMNYTLPYKRVRTFTVIYLVIIDNLLILIYIQPRLYQSIRSLEADIAGSILLADLFVIKNILLFMQFAIPSMCMHISRNYVHNTSLNQYVKFESDPYNVQRRFIFSYN
mgnify:CR=1 FL=1